MDTEINVKVNYVGFTRRIVAEILDLIIFFPDFIFAFIYRPAANQAIKKRKGG